MSARQIVDASNSPPCFLVSAQRTGSTLLRVMLNAHPEIRFVRHVAIEAGLDYLDDHGTAETDLEPYYLRLAGSHDFHHGDLTIDRSLPLIELLRDFLRQEQSATTKPLLGGALHHNFPRLLSAFPDARFICLYRDGRDTARSAVAIEWEDNYWTAVRPWMIAVQQARMMRTKVPDDRWLDVRFEELVLHPRRVLAQICAFMGTTYDEAIFSYTETTNYKHPDPKMVEQWRRKMSSAQIRLAEARIGPLLEEHGYPLSGLPRLEVSPAMVRRYETKGAWKARFRRMRRVGLFNFVADILTRSLGMAKLNSRVLLRIDTQRQKMLL